MSDIRQSPLWASYLEKFGWYVDRLDGNFIYIKKIPLLGSFIKIQRVKNFDLKKIDVLRKKYRAFYIKIEPDFSATKSFIHSLQKTGFKKDNFPLAPPKTIWIEITYKTTMLLTQMHAKTRYNIKLAQKKVIIKKSNNSFYFANHWAKNQKLLSFFSKKEIETFFQVFGPKNAFILFAYHKKMIVAGVLIGLWQKKAYYMFAFSTKEGKRKFAPTLLVWQAILEAKRLGCKIFDFEGIYDPRYHTTTKSWQGFTRFKKSFGGKEIEYPETFSKTFLPFIKLFSG